MAVSSKRDIVSEERHPSVDMSRGTSAAVRRRRNGRGRRGNGGAYDGLGLRSARPSKSQSSLFRPERTLENAIGDGDGLLLRRRGGSARVTWLLGRRRDNTSSSSSRPKIAPSMRLERSHLLSWLPPRPRGGIDEKDDDGDDATCEMLLLRRWLVRGMVEAVPRSLSVVWVSLECRRLLKEDLDRWRR